MLNVSLFLVLLPITSSVQTIQPAFPEVPVVFSPIDNFFQRSGLDAAAPPLCVAALGHQARPLKHTQMLGDGGLGQGERCGKFAHRAFPHQKARQDGAAGGVSKGGEGRT